MNGRNTLILAALALRFLSADISPAAPHRGDVFSLRQPDGSRVDVKVYGDEFYQRVESMDGFTLVRDGETGWICYAEGALDGESFVSTGVIYRGAVVADWDDSQEKAKVEKLAKGLKLKRRVVRRRAEARRVELMGGKQVAEIEAKASPAPLVGSIKGLTMLIQFPDEMGTISQSEVNDYCNQVGYTGYGNNGSIRDYFYDVSNENLEYTNYVTAYYTTVNNKSYYDDCSGGRTHELLSEALNWLDDQGFDFSILSLNSSNRIEALNVFYAGSPDCGWANGLWPHSGGYSGFTSDVGVRSGDYQITNIGSELRIGTFCHENGHMICDWPDLYDYGYESQGIGSYGLMAYSGSRNPRPPNPYFRDLRGWETIIEIGDDTPGTLRFHEANSFTTYRYSHPTNPEESFLVESRLQNGRNEGIPDEGLLIWHVDGDGSNNNEQMTPEQHYRVSVEQADGQFHLERNNNGGGGGDLFHAGDNDTFDDYTLPDARWWDGVESGMRIRDISAVGANMSFVVDNVPVDLMVAPGVAVELGGFVGGPFAPSAASYTLTNLGDSAINWTVSARATWLSAPAGGTLSVGGSTVVDIDLTAAAETLPPGTYSDTILFTDTTNGAVRQREVKLVVGARELIAHWKLDETSGTVVGDATGHGHTGEVQGSTFDAGSQAGKFGQALDFDGVDDTLFFEGFALPRPFFTTSFWFNPDSDLSGSDGRDDFFYWDSGGHLHITFNKHGGGEIGLFITLDGVEYENMYTTTESWAASVWHNIAFTFDTSDFKVYVNGNLENTINHPGIPADTTDPYIGSNKGDNNFFDGQIDDVRFYNYAMSSDGVMGLFRGGRAENPIPADGSTGVRPYTAMTWLEGCTALRHDVYLGQDSDSVANATTDSAEYQGRLDENLFAGAALYENTEYFWRVDEVASSRGGIIGGAVWSFTTGSAGEYEQIYEAEDAYLSGPEVKSSYPDYTGTGYIDYINESDDYAEWSVFAHYSGTHEFEFRYALASGDRPLEIRINGEVIEESLSFPSTGSWADWSYTERISGMLNAGNNILRATIADYKGANVDHLRIIEDYPYTSESEPGLQVCLQLDESSGETTGDSSENARHGTLHGGPVWQAWGGEFAGALQLDGTDDYVEIESYRGVTGSQSRTVGAWVQVAGAATGDIISWGADTAGKRWSLGFTGRGGAVGVKVADGSILAATSVIDGNWHHVAAVLADDGSANLDEIQLYIDGRVETLGSIPSQQIDTAIAANVKIGTFDDGLGLYFGGMVDDVVIFDVALTGTQVARLCRVGSQSFLVPCGRIILDEDYNLDGDVNKDCKVDALDLVLLSEDWLDSGLSLLGDIHEDNTVNWFDVSVLGANWHEESSSPDTP